MKNIIVTGGSGYIGSHVVQYLQDNGITTFIVDKNYSKVESFRTHHQLTSLGAGIDFDCGYDFSMPARAFFGLEPIDAIIHLAGYIDVKESTENPLKYLDNNTANTIHLLRTAEKLKVSNIIFSSTAAVYQSSDNQLKENNSLLPSNPYGLSKLLAEESIKSSNMNYIIFRFFNASGADKFTRMGENHNPETHLIPRILDNLNKEKDVLVFGNDYSTPDGTCIRDYVHVSDIASAHYLALKYLENNRESKIINLGSGEFNSVSSVINIAEKITGIYSNTKILPRRNGDPAILMADISEAKSSLNWIPQRSDLHTIISDAWKWYKVIN